MNAKEKTYAMALAALLLVGLSTAWAGYNAISRISTGTIEDFVTTVSGSSPTSLSNLKKNVWFYRNLGTVFTISGVKVSTIYVIVGVINMAELADKFKALDFNITLKNPTSGSTIDWGVISLEGGVSTVLLTATGTSTVNVDVYVCGIPKTTITKSVDIQMYCAVEPAVVVTP